MAAESRPSPMGLAVLAMLVPGPLHPYGIQRLMKHWGKGNVINLEQRANLYKTIKRLHEAGLIAVRQTERGQQYPERTVYELTEDGRRQAAQWLYGMLATVRNEFPQFPAALSFAMGLPPDQIRAALEQRAAVLRKELARIDQDLNMALPRVTLLDDEYLHAVTAAELNWIDGVLDDLRTGALNWSKEQLASVAIPGLAPLAPDLTPGYIPDDGNWDVEPLNAEPGPDGQPPAGR